MNKKLLYGLMAAALMATSACSSEEPVAMEGDTLVTFTVELPAQLQGRTYGDGYTAKKLEYQVYDHNGNVLGDLKDNGNVVFGDGELTKQISLRLAKSRSYTILCWAAANDVNVPYTFNRAEQTISANYTNVTANSDLYDAFFGKAEFTVSGPVSTTIELRRPFAQINIGATDIAEAASAGWTTTETQVTVNRVYSKFNLSTGAVVGDYGPVTYTYAAKPTTPESFPVAGVDYQAMVYVLTAPTQNLVTVDFDAVSGVGSTVLNRSYANVPVQRNFRTNIYGNILTDQADITVEIKPAFEITDNDVYVATATTAADLTNALVDRDAEKIVIDLPAGTLDWTIDANNYFGSTNTKEIEIRGAGVDQTTLQFTGSDVEYLEAKNPNAKLVLNDLTVNRTQDPGAFETRTVVFRNCNVEINNVVFNRAILFDCVGKTVNLNNVTVNERAAGNYAGWTTPGVDMTLHNCVFNAPDAGSRALKVYDDYTPDPQPTTITVTGCTFTFQNKSAILVKSKSTTDIVWGAGNTVNYPTTYSAEQKVPVWVDSDRASYFDLVTVTGASKYQE